ncbi:MAG: DUF2157 domain-containing protein [Vicinamibacterales bacterium]
MAEERETAQRRADRVRAFREEIDALRAEGACPIADAELAAVRDHHDRLLADLASRFDVDRTAHGRQVSLGLRIATLLGAGAFVAALTLLVLRVWCGLGQPAQVTLLCAAPLAALAVVQVTAERRGLRDIAALFAMVALGTAWFAIGQTATLLGMPFSPLLFWPAAGFGIAVAMSYGFGLVLALSLGALLVAVASVFFVSGGVPWSAVFERLEPLVGTAWMLAIVAPRAEPLGNWLVAPARLTGLVVGLGGLLVLAAVEGTSVLALQPSSARLAYECVFPFVSIVVTWQRLRAHDPAAARLAGTLLGCFLLIRYVDWFWDLLPGWAFFLVLGALSLAAIGLLQRARSRVEHA